MAIELTNTHDWIQANERERPIPASGSELVTHCMLELWRNQVR